jgi:hypothetical protein
MVAIGATGHRFLVEMDKLTTGVDAALRRIEEAFPGQSLTVISPLAEGADRLVVRRALTRPGTRLIVPLPLPESDYMADFGTAESREEFLTLLDRADQVLVLSPAPTRPEAYMAAGRCVVDLCDVLVALWDGREAQGSAGTAEIVAEARRRGLPLVWVHAGNRVPGTEEPTSLGEKQGKVTFERFPHPARADNLGFDSA